MLPVLSLKEVRRNHVFCFFELFQKRNPPKKENHQNVTVVKFDSQHEPLVSLLKVLMDKTHLLMITGSSF